MFEPKENYCPLLKKTCIKSQCAWWVSVQGYDSNTGQNVNRQECVITTLPLLLIENSFQQRGTGAAVESLRNESVAKSQQTNELLAAIVMNRVVPAQISESTDHTPNILTSSDGV